MEYPVTNNDKPTYNAGKQLITRLEREDIRISVIICSRDNVNKEF